MHLPDNCANEKGRKLIVKLTWVSRKIVEFFPISTADTFTKQAHFVTFMRTYSCLKCLPLVYFGSGCPEERPLGVTLQSQGPL